MIRIDKDDKRVVLSDAMFVFFSILLRLLARWFCCGMCRISFTTSTSSSATTLSREAEVQHITEEKLKNRSKYGPARNYNSAMMINDEY